MTDDSPRGEVALGRRAVACRGWKWMPGMRWQTSDDHGRLDDFQPEYLWCPDRALPDLQDPATVGCLLALVRDAWGDPHASVWYDSEYWQSGDRWSWHAKKESRVDYDTEAEALVAALEAAS